MADVSGHSAVRAMKRPRLENGQPHQRFELFPTPPWATRALFERVLPAIGDLGWPPRGPDSRLWDPCAGLGHMAAVLREYSSQVMASDIAHYALDGGGNTELLGIEKLDFMAADRKADWIITNPPFASAELFVEPALRQAARGVAFFERMQWLEGCGRFARIFSRWPPAVIAPFAGRVPVCEGGYDPDGSTATMYAWFVWVKNINGCLRDRLGRKGTLQTYLIPPETRNSLFMPHLDLRLATRCVPGWVPPSHKRLVRKAGAAA
ncbi:MAG: hypothetical protein L0Y60_07635 [Beijerinckiaceae bacterium]|nr:hypothetical protein [Beijerinckiaceae bacterium]